MGMLESVLGNDAAGVVQQLGRQFGLDEAQTSSALAALLPALVAGFHQTAANPTGLGSLLDALRGGQHQQYVDDPRVLGRPDVGTAGNDILGQIFGSKDVSREVARRASTQTGVSSDILKRMLPVVAALVMGALARRQFGGASAQAQAGMVPSPGAQAAGGSLLDILAPMLDANRNGTMVDDVIGMIGKAMGGR